MAQDDLPPEDLDALKAWLKNKSKADPHKLIDENHQPADFEESGVIFGTEEALNQTDAEAFPSEPEEHSPEERRNNFKVYESDKSKGE